jgi:exonuclease VII large subunit
LFDLGSLLGIEFAKTSMHLLGDSGERVDLAVLYTVDRAERWLETVHRLLTAYDPQRRLVQGWSIVSKPDGSIVRSVHDVTDGEDVVIRVGDGEMAASIMAREEKDG